MEKHEHIKDGAYGRISNQTSIKVIRYMFIILSVLVSF